MDDFTIVCIVFGSIAGVALIALIIFIIYGRCFSDLDGPSKWDDMERARLRV